MPLRCLLFSSNEELRPPIWQVLAALGIEGEYCPSAVDAVERVTTQLFQIVITDWEDQPEAAFLLKTARDLKAAVRPLTLAVVGDEARVPEALQAGANSVLLKPIRVEQVRDTMGTACELLRARQNAASSSPPVTAGSAQTTPDLASVRSTASSAAAAPARAKKSEPEEKVFRAGEFLASSAPAPGAQFDTESDVPVSPDQSAPEELEALNELEPMASPVESESEPKAPVTGWASLQNRLNKAAPQKPAESGRGELLTYGDMSGFSPPPEPAPSNPQSVPEKRGDTKAEEELFAYIEGKSAGEVQAKDTPPKKINGVLIFGIGAAVCMALLVIPQTRQRLQSMYGGAVHSAKSWLNPQPAPVQQAAPQHETFNSDEEYKLPAAGNNPEAGTDASQIRVVPVIDPTVKPNKNADPSGAIAVSNNNIGGSQSQAPADNGQVQAVENPVKEQSPANIGSPAANGAPAEPMVQPSIQAQTAPVAHPIPQQQVALPAPVRSSSPPPIHAANSATVPSSLKSQMASMTPDASGTKPVDAAMSAIEPVNLPETTAWELLTQPVDPVYPDAAKAAGQHGNVVLQVLIGRDGVVQDAKFLQGSLMFARAGIDAVKQWHFKPYIFNGRPVSVQTVITLKFNPPASR